jgi:hypothetical protein
MNADKKRSYADYDGGFLLAAILLGDVAAVQRSLKCFA